MLQKVGERKQFNMRTFKNILFEGWTEKFYLVTSELVLDAFSFNMMEVFIFDAQDKQTKCEIILQEFHNGMKKHKIMKKLKKSKRILIPLADSRADVAFTQTVIFKIKNIKPDEKYDINVRLCQYELSKGTTTKEE